MSIIEKKTGQSSFVETNKPGYGCIHLLGDLAEKEILDQYYLELGRYPVLNHSQQRIAFAYYHEGLTPNHLKSDDRLMNPFDPESRGKFILTCQESASIEDLITRCSQALVVSVASKTNPLGGTLLTRIQYGNFGLLHAIRRFYYQGNLHFSTYAFPCIRGAILNGLNKTTDHQNEVLSLNHAFQMQDGKQNEQKYTPEETVATPGPALEDVVIGSWLTETKSRLLQVFQKLTPEEVEALQNRFGLNICRTNTVVDPGDNKKTDMLVLSALTKLSKDADLRKAFGLAPDTNAPPSIANNKSNRLYRWGKVICVPTNPGMTNDQNPIVFDPKTIAAVKEYKARRMNHAQISKALGIPIEEVYQIAFQLKTASPKT